jgi:hypothetical protein
MNDRNDGGKGRIAEGAKKTVRERVRLAGDFSAPLRSGRNDGANAFARRANTENKANAFAGGAEKEMRIEGRKFFAIVPEIFQDILSIFAYSSQI